ncbi:hypothetical protein HMPREF0765_0301 [Sphingobacterium spiritivorum ATCC 33300]|uniref:Uncharacterized protein n=1 Tax=Sphingobacterium spiritivorum ATCC 33300 TaxID=525372 RepID=C2FSJ5_SPHSI|nr:hypothetical protein HMPREF0765_0301 [Sphingobacterium spiritivorum ATCC 33300]
MHLAKIAKSIYMKRSHYHQIWPEVLHNKALTQAADNDLRRTIKLIFFRLCNPQILIYTYFKATLS